ncbi:MAG: dihydroorotase [Acidobacteriota bacterium]|nr:MAG: dihydroorotase [Acidobacteriota bacterium]
MGPLLLKRARVLDPASQLDGVRDILIEQGRIQRLAPELDATGARVVDLEGLVLTPGLIDMHVHLREPGQEAKETIASGCAAAAAGGFTAVAAMANTDPVNDCRAVTELIVNEAQRQRSVRVYPVGAVSEGLRGERLAAIDEMVAAGVVAISDDGRPVMNGSLMRRALEQASRHGIPVLVHEQDETIVGEGVVHEGEVSARLHIPGWPAAGEDAMIGRDLMLVEDIGGRLHIQHLTTARGAALVRWARARGVRVTCEATPHHLTLTDEAVAGLNTDLKMNPPLRPERDRRGLVEALIDRTIDAIATDHAPHHPNEKAVEFCCAPFGTIGLETAVPVLIERLVRSGSVSLLRLVELLSLGPARALGVAGGRVAIGAPADLTVLDLEREGTIDAERFRSLSRNTAFPGWRAVGWPVMSLVGGRVVYDAR